MKRLAVTCLLLVTSLVGAGCQTVEPPSPGGRTTGGAPSWSIQYQGAIQVRNKTFHVVDLFDVSDNDLSKIRGAGSRPIAYFSSQYENWRPDSKRFAPSDLGKPLSDWPGERWVNTRSATVRSIIKSRLDLAKRRGFYGVDVDNTDLYEHTTGFDNSHAVAQGLRTRIIVDNLLQFDCEATGLAWKRDDSIRT
jgi:endo-alpha-1,4-polygalactosaminidase (GH114 family)